MLQPLSQRDALVEIIDGRVIDERAVFVIETERQVVAQFVVIGLSEEISFRGFIQPRLYPLLKREWLVVLVGGALFVGMHYPFQMAARNMTFGEYWPLFIGNAPMQFIWHLAFTWLYRRYGNLYGSAVLHGCVDMCAGIFA